MEYNVKFDINREEWWPVYIPSFCDKYAYLKATIPENYEFSEEEVNIIKIAFMLFESAQELISSKMKEEDR